MPTKNKTEKRKIPPIQIDNAKLIWKNLSGAAKQYNAKGIRNFHVVLEPDLAQVLEADGWNVRWHEAREEGDPAWPSIKVFVRFDNYPPRIVQITSKSKTVLDEETVGVLDWAEITKVDLILSPSQWENNGKKGIKAYLRKMFVTLDESDLEARYSDVGGSDKHVEEDDSD